MTEPPEIKITHGDPTPDEAEAVRAAILKLWREDQADAARNAGMDPWTLAARAEAVRAGSGIARARAPRNAWKLSGRIGTDSITADQTGRGDAK